MGLTALKPDILICIKSHSAYTRIAGGSSAVPCSDGLPEATGGFVHVDVICSGSVQSQRSQDMEHDAAVQHAELRRRLAADGNGAAADALRVQAAGFEEACDFKEASTRPASQ